MAGTAGFKFGVIIKYHQIIILAKFSTHTVQEKFQNKKNCGFYSFC